MFSNNIKTQKDAPYWDDFQENVEGLGKNYIKILFRPGRSVQARELTQMQTLLQSQINKFGKSVYKEGTPVIGGQCIIKNEIAWIKIATYGSGITGAMLAASQAELTQKNGSDVVIVKASVIGSSDGPGGNYLYIQYTLGTAFSGGVTLGIINDIRTITPSNEAQHIGYGLASCISVNSGVYFVAGAFVENAQQKVFVKHTIALNIDQLITGYAAFKINETIVDYTQDSTLLDNSAGTSNYNAPGADRHKIDLVLEFIDSTDSEPRPQYIRLLNIVNGKVFIAQKTEYSKLDDTLAQRTYEESGNYTVRPFIIDIREQSKLLDPIRGTGGTSDISEKDNYVVGVEPGVAYVNGYRVELLERKDIVVAKPRIDIFSTPVLPITVSYGSYIIGSIDTTNTTTLPLISNRNLVYKLLTNANAITSDNLIGSCHVTSVEYHSPTEIRVFISDINLAQTKIFTNAKYLRLTDSAALVSASTGLPEASGSFTKDSSTFSLTNTAGFALYDSNLSSLVFPLSQSRVKSLRKSDNSIDVRHYVRGHFTGAVSVDASISSVTIQAESGIPFVSNTAIDYVLYNKTKKVKLVVTAILLLANGASAKITFTQVGSEAGDSISMITHSLVITQSTASDNVRSKTLKNGYTLFGINEPITGNFYYDSGGLTAVQYLTLMHSDIVKIVKVIRLSDTVSSGAPVAITNAQFTSIDIANFILDNGQRDTYYDKGSIQNITSYATIEPGIRIDYLYFEHDGDTSSGGGSNLSDQRTKYFIADSYADVTLTGVDGVQYSTSDLTHSYHNNILTDCIDFRRSKFNHGSSAVAQQLEPNSLITTTIQIYKSRLDILVVDGNLKFSVIEGIPALMPIAPTIPLLTLPLYTFSVPGYATTVKDIKISPIHNQRYTMKDIGELESRISNLEYYTSLSLLETQTSQKSILSATGGERFKNGFFVDGFIGSNMANVHYPGYLCSIDHNKFILRPFVEVTDSRLILKDVTNAANGIGASTLLTNKYNVRLSSEFPHSILTLPYTSVPLIEQVYSSISMNINPSGIFTWAGIIELSPSSDNWTEVRDVEVVVDDFNLYNAMKAFRSGLSQGGGGIGTFYGAWYSGGDFALPGYTYTVQYRNYRTVSTAELSFKDTKTTKTKSEEILIAFIRSRKIYFKASLMKPNTLVYPFFDNVRISGYARKETSFENYGNLQSVTTYANNTSHPSGINDLVTNADGTLIGSFIIPWNDTVKFKTGDRIFKLSDSITNDAKATTTFAQGLYTASNTLVINTTTKTTTREVGPVITKTITEQDPTVFTRYIRKCWWSWFDPLAQTFVIGDIPEGCFITSVDLFFRTKSIKVGPGVSQVVNNTPVTMYIVECVNGTPTQTFIPESQVILYPANINISEDASSATNFKFKTPIYLKSGIEYALVLVAATDAYEVWVSQVGDFNNGQTQQRITKDPYAGVLFESSNASTWTAHQNRDLKFIMYRAKFETSQTLAGKSTFSIDLRSVNTSIMQNGVINNSLTEYASLINLASAELQFLKTSLTWSLKFFASDADGANSSLTPLVGIPLRSNEDLTLATRQTFNYNTYAVITATFATTSEYVSPVLDLERLSLRKIHNIINWKNYAKDLTTGTIVIPPGQNDVGIYAAKCRYVTPDITLNNPADQLNIYMSISLPNFTDVQVYAKLRADNSDINDTPWQPVSLIPGTFIPYTDDQTLFTEVHFAILDSTAAEKFISCMVKIEMLANDDPTDTSVGRPELTTLTPLIKDLRIIATT